MSRWIKSSYGSTKIILNKTEETSKIISRLESIFKNINSEDPFANYSIVTNDDTYEIICEQGHTYKAGDSILASVKELLENKGIEFKIEGL